MKSTIIGLLVFGSFMSNAQSLLLSSQNTVSKSPNTYGFRHEIPAQRNIYTLNGSNKGLFTDSPPFILAVNNGAPAVKIDFTNIEHVNYTALGSNAPLIKTKLLTGVLPAFDGSSISSSVVHGIGDYTKILAVNIEVTVPPLGLNPARTYPEEYTFEPGYQVSYFINGGGIIVINSNGNSFNVRNMPFKVYITYEQ
jgi:hypothetical protein